MPKHRQRDIHPRESLRHSAWNFQQGKNTFACAACDIDEPQTVVALRTAASSTTSERRQASRAANPFVPWRHVIYACDTNAPATAATVPCTDRRAVLHAGDTPALEERAHDGQRSARALGAAATILRYPRAAATRLGIDSQP